MSPVTWSGDFRTPVLVRSAIANGVSLPDSNLIVFGANDFSDEAGVTARSGAGQAKSARLRLFVSDFRDLTVGDYVVHVEHGIGRYLGLKEIVQDGVKIEFMVLEFAEQASALCSAYPPRSDSEVPFDLIPDPRPC